MTFDLFIHIPDVSTPTTVNTSRRDPTLYDYKALWHLAFHLANLFKREIASLTAYILLAIYRTDRSLTAGFVLHKYNLALADAQVSIEDELWYISYLTIGSELLCEWSQNDPLLPLFLVDSKIAIRSNAFNYYRTRKQIICFAPSIFPPRTHDRETCSKYSVQHFERRQRFIQLHFTEFSQSIGVNK